MEQKGLDLTPAVSQWLVGCERALVVAKVIPLPLGWPYSYEFLSEGSQFSPGNFWFKRLWLWGEVGG